MYLWKKFSSEACFLTWKLWHRNFRSCCGPEIHVVLYTVISRGYSHCFTSRVLVWKHVVAMIHPCALCGGTSLVPYFPCFPSFFMRMSFHLRMDYALFSWWIFILLNSGQGQVEGMGEMGCGILLQGSFLSTLPAVAPLFYFHSFFSLWFSCGLLGHTRDMELALPKGTFLPFIQVLLITRCLADLICFLQFKWFFNIICSTIFNIFNNIVL